MMRGNLAALLRRAAIVIMVVAWATLAHIGSTGDGPPNLAAALAATPLVAIVIILLWRTGNLLWPIAGGLAVLALAAWWWPVLRENVALLYFIQHVGTNLALGALFGRSLVTGREALVTQFSRMAHNGQLSPSRTRYTRQVTVAWTAFFVTMAALSTALFVAAPPAVWSLFANLLTLPLLGLMFAAEHLVRLRVLPPEDRPSIADTIRGYRAAMEQRRNCGLADQP